MPIDSIQRSATTPTAVSQEPREQLGKDDFMKLLVTQLRQQDPLDPMDAREMVTQLTQLTSVEKLTSLEQNLAALRIESAGMASMQAQTLIGREVSADTSHVTLGAEGAATGSYLLQGRAEHVRVTIRDGNNQLVRTLELGAQGPGPQALSWDGAGDGGARLPSGRYSFEVSARDSAEVPVTVSTRVQGRVSAVSYEGGTPELHVGASRVLLGDVTAIAQ